MTTQTATAIRTETDVTFRKNTKYAITYAAGSIFEDWYPTEDGKIVIARGGSKHTATISMDDATPVEWNELDHMWWLVD